MCGDGATGRGGRGRFGGVPIGLGVGPGIGCCSGIVNRVTFCEVCDGLCGEWDTGIERTGSPGGMGWWPSDRSTSELGVLTME